MDVDAGVEEKKGGEAGVSATAAVSTERTQKGKGEGDRNIMLHPVSDLFCLNSVAPLLHTSPRFGCVPYMIKLHTAQSRT